MNYAEKEAKSYMPLRNMLNAWTSKKDARAF